MMPVSKYFRRPAVKERSTQTLVLVSLGFIISAVLVVYAIGDDWGSYTTFIPITALVIVSWTLVFRGWKLGKSTRDGEN
jgi:uncharacterized membrane protein YqjE